MRIKLLIVLIATLSCVNSQARCPDGWTKWKDEKCYLLTQNFSNFADVREACRSLRATLANVKEEEDQLFLTNYIFETSKVDVGVWIGATRVEDSPTEFQWEDGTPLDYVNWAVASPTELDGRNCVQMLSNYTKAVECQGTWRDTTCNNPMYYLCETKPSWTIADIIAVLIETRKNLDETMSTLDDTNQRLDEKIKNPVPVGFIYTQFPQQPVPSTLWPEVTWTEVTAEFAGKFFRAAGGSAAGFGKTQNEDSPRLSHVRAQSVEVGEYVWNITVVPGTWSSPIYSGSHSWGGELYGQWFYVTNAEVRPTNTAIRIWKRLA